MAHPPSESGPSDQSYYTSIETYTNRGQHASQGGVINNNINQYNSLKELEKRCSHSAAFDSAARSDPPRCSESTRLQIIQIIAKWVNSEDTAVPSSLFWLRGGAGVGKSALAQSLSEDFHSRNQLAASFFFFRGDPTRNNGNQLIPTIVSHLIHSLKAIVPFVDNSIRENPPLFTKRHQIQIQGLLVEPLLNLKSKGFLVAVPRLIVIDGLDECENQEVQRGLLQAIACAIPQIPFPLRFLVTSRPEAHITDVFKHDPALQALTIHQYNLSDDLDADLDIRNFLKKEFLEIRQFHRIGRHLPPTWPETAIDSLVERSSRHFIYASTVIRYIKSPKHRPDDRLENILRLQPHRSGDKPYAQLDALYALIFFCVEGPGQLEKICLVLGILYFQSRRAGLFVESTPDFSTIEGLLEMKAGDLVLLLDPILSLVSTDHDQVRILHKSLFDYLLDSTRRGQLPFDIFRVHEVAAMYILKDIVGGVCGIKNLQHFAYHCQYACLNDTLRIYLKSLEPSSFTNLPIESIPNSRRELQPILWFLFRTLTREVGVHFTFLHINSIQQIFKDLDPTRQVHEQYAVKWMRYLQSLGYGIRDGKQSKINAVCTRYFNTLKSWLKLAVRLTPPEEGGDVKRQLDTLLTEWTPRTFEDVGTNLIPDTRVTSIKHEHNVFSAYTKASFSGNTAAVFSSLVFGDHFIHSYNCRNQGQGGLYLRLQTYSRHDNKCYQHEFVVTPGNIVRSTLDYLSNVEKFLFSDLYQKYGLDPDEDTFTTGLEAGSTAY